MFYNNFYLEPFNLRKPYKYIYDLGAVEPGRKYHYTPLQSLDSKEFSTGFYQRWHLILQDAGRQIGFPHGFITVSPFEWTFPKVCSFRYILQGCLTFANSYCMKLITWSERLLFLRHIHLFYKHVYYNMHCSHDPTIYISYSADLPLILFIRSNGFTINN